MDNPLLILGILVVLLILNGFFSGSELGVVSARKSRLQGLADRGNRAAQRALNLAERPGAFLATVQIGITLIGTVSAVFAGDRLTPHVERALTPLLGSAAGVVAEPTVVLLVTYLSLVLGELAPKSIALRNPEALALRVAPFFTLLSGLTRPIVWLLEATTRGLLWLLGLRGEPQEHVTEEDVKAIVLQASETGGLEEGERERIDHVLRFNDRRVRELMTPRGDATLIPATAPLDDVVSRALAAPHDRYPVVDGHSQVVGQISVVDLLQAVHTGEAWLDRVRPVIYVPETAWAEDVLNRLTQQGHQQIAIAVDEFGMFTGLITSTDLLRELAGADQPADPNELFRRDDGSYLADGALAMHDLRERLPLPRLEREDFSTLAGYVLGAMGEFPQVGAQVRVEDWLLEVVDLDGARIDRVLIVPPVGVVVGGGME
ncbi:hemolysin family protein [Deinococcus aquaedulcis]|uniref:hemolysin family protein n=1 Tax=Deinococcus aquaedulcis TaxID=2840455 RepID=UPI001C8283A9|nr:hemolysin family protein [Deinococcus aquaedulcis]